MRLFWISLAGVCAAAAVVFLIRQRLDAAFVAGALAGVAWFLSYRMQLKRILAEDETSEGIKGDDDDSEE